MSIRNGLGLAVKEHISAGQPITRLEAMLLYGVSNLTDLIANLRKQGWVIKSRQIPLALPIRRLKESVMVEAPKNLPTREIMVTEYWLSE